MLTQGKSFGGVLEVQDILVFCALFVSTVGLFFFVYVFPY